MKNLLNFTIKFAIIDDYLAMDGYKLDNFSFLKFIGLCFKRLKFGKNLQFLRIEFNDYCKKRIEF